MIWTILITAVAMVILSVLVNNFIPSERKIKQALPHTYGVRDPQFARSIGQLLGPPILEGNRVEPLRNGREIFPAMLEAIAHARCSVTFETYIWHEGKVATRFAQALAERARAGIKVHVLFDAVGCSGGGGPEVALMREAGVEVEVYHLSNVARFNFRTHRKLLVVDGILGFIGGVGIDDAWDGNADSPEFWRDNHYRVAGPVVAQLQAAFNDNWMKARARVLDGPDYFPSLEPAGGLRCQVFKSSPQEGSESARLMFLLSIAAAARSIHIGNAYFVPDDLTVRTLLAAKERGVAVEIILPGDHQDSKLVRAASRQRCGRLLAAGVRIFEFQPTPYHCKSVVIDSIWTSVGSSNFDNRSFRLNDEANLNILDEDFAAAELESFGRDRERSRETTHEEWRNRPLSQKFVDIIATFLRSQL